MDKTASKSHPASLATRAWLLASTAALLAASGGAVRVERHLAVEGEDAAFVAVGGGAWIRLPQEGNGNLAFQMLSSDGENVIDASVDKKKFIFKKMESGKFKLIIKGVTFADAGTYGCGNNYKFELEVVTKPECVKLTHDLYENQMTKFQCRSRVTSTDLIVPMNWTFRKKTKQGSLSQEKDSIISSYALTPSMEDNGQDLTCAMGRVDGWITSKTADAKCHFDDLNVRFNPRLECERIQQVSEKDKFYQVSCTILSNPIIPKKNISWYMVNDANMRESMEVRLLEFDVMNNGVKIVVAVPKSIISPRYPYQTVVVHAKGESESATKNVMLELLYSPKIHCPKQRVVSLSLPTYQVSCEILANPMVNLENITWSFQNHSRKIGDQMHDNRVIQGGMRIIMTLDEDMMSGFQDKTVEFLKVSVDGPDYGRVVQHAVALRGIVVIDEKTDKDVDWTQNLDGELQNEERPKEKRNVFGIFFKIPELGIKEYFILGCGAFVLVLLIIFLMMLHAKGIICGGSQKIKPYIQYKERRANWHMPAYNIVKSTNEEDLSISHLDVDMDDIPPPPPPPPRAPTPPPAPPPGPTALEQAAAIASGGHVEGPGGKHRRRKGSKSAQNSPAGGHHKGHHKSKQSPGRQNGHCHVPPPPPPPSASKSGKSAKEACISAPVSACSTPWHYQEPGAGKSGSYGNLTEDENWQNGFSKMSAALRTKDNDMDGYLTTDEVMSVVDSYNMVYRLGLGRDRVEEALRTCSNGTVVDYETLLHMLKQLSGHV